jgi:hypothetical protein
MRLRLSAIMGCVILVLIQAGCSRPCHLNSSLFIRSNISDIKFNHIEDQGTSKPLRIPPAKGDLLNSVVDQGCYMGNPANIDSFNQAMIIVGEDRVVRKPDELIRQKVVDIYIKCPREGSTTNTVWVRLHRPAINTVNKFLRETNPDSVYSCSALCGVSVVGLRIGVNYGDGQSLLLRSTLDINTGEPITDPYF